MAVSCWLLAIGCFQLPGAKCQVPSANYQLQFTIEGPVKNFTTDLLQNVYVLTTESEVVKYTPDGVEQFRYPNKTLGAIGSMDATNPFHILLFFPEYQNVLLLDRTLSVSGQFNLFKLGLFQITTVGMSSDNMLWLYDEVGFRLKKITEDGDIAAESNDLSLTIGKSIHPVQLLEKGQSVFLNDPKEGILVFDVFGQYLKTLDLKGVTDFQVLDDELYYCRGGKLSSFHLKSLLERNILLPADLKAVQKVRLEKDYIYILGEEGLKVYRY